MFYAIDIKILLNFDNIFCSQFKIHNPYLIGTLSINVGRSMQIHQINEYKLNYFTII